MLSSLKAITEGVYILAGDTQPLPSQSLKWFNIVYTADNYTHKYVQHLPIHFQGDVRKISKISSQGLLRLESGLKHWHSPT